MTSPATFWPEALPYAQEVHAATGVLVSVLLAQAGIETAYGGWDWSVAHNPGNVGSFDGEPVNKFSSLATGTKAWIQTLELGYYKFVRSASGYVNQCLALGVSPWASAHYALLGGGPGSELIYVVQHYSLTQFDGAAPPAPVNPVPIPPFVPSANPTPQEILMGLPSGCTDVNAVREHIRRTWNEYHTDVMTAAVQNLFQLCFYEPLASGGYAGNPDLLSAGIIDAATKTGTVRSDRVGSV